MLLTPISAAEFASILQQSEISHQDRVKLQSFTIYSLLNSPDYADMSANEKAVVAQLEEKNLYRILNVAAILAGAFGENVRDQLLGLPTCKQIVRDIRQDASSSKREQDRLIYFMLMLHSLANFSSNIRAIPEFAGKVPNKLFKFRQLTADTWFGEVAKKVSYTAGCVYADGGHEEALAYVTGYIAYYLNKSQPTKYFARKDDNDDNDAIYDIITRFVSNVSGDKRVFTMPGIF